MCDLVNILILGQISFSYIIPVAKPWQRTEASSACVHDVELSTEPIDVFEEQLNRDSSVVPQLRSLIQIRPVP